MCDCMDNRPEFFETSRVKARKTHECCECLSTIVVGEMHWYERGKWDGNFDAYRTCDRCKSLVIVLGLDCYCFGELMDYCDERDGIPEAAAFLELRRRNYEANLAVGSAGTG